MKHDCRRRILCSAASIFVAIAVLQALAFWTGPVRRVEEEIRSYVTASSLSRLPHSNYVNPADIQNRTLVIYVYHESNTWYIDNLQFFIEVRYGMLIFVRPKTIATHPTKNIQPLKCTQIAINQQPKPAAGRQNLVDYVFLVNGRTRNQHIFDRLSMKHPNVLVLKRPNRCFDGGSIGEFLQNRPHLKDVYKYFVFVNSSVRGPFLPRYYHERPWTRVFTDLINDDVKLVGTTISCQRSIHVQSMVLAMDRIALDVIRSAGALECHESLGSAISKYELGATTAVLNSGYNIACMLSRYQGLDWRDHRQLVCNGGLNPQLDGMNDGLSLNPYEVVFVKAKQYQQAPDVTAFLSRYTDYMMRDAGDEHRLAGNGYFSQDSQRKLANEWAELQKKAKRCHWIFDEAFYLAENPDLGSADREYPFQHFKTNGFRERRAFRYRREHLGAELRYHPIAGSDCNL
jgi:hypothetical protein